MQSTDQQTLDDEARRAYLNEEARKSRDAKRARTYIGHPKGVTKVELPANWLAIKRAIRRNIKPEHKHETRAISSCVANLLGIAPAAIGRGLGVDVHRVSLDIDRKDRECNLWMKDEVKRIADKCPRPVNSERKAA